MFAKHAATYIHLLASLFTEVLVVALHELSLHIQVQGLLQGGLAPNV